ncbi:B3/B4 domain-containing protein [Aeropyrum camini]|uniref:B3/B4 domain-containing protein n=1 Tax=Aeropyrum camini TaxID=229980 RepID=UPI0012E1B426|nr:B3/4 domain-containing protein [Aeropyrum camini]
MGVVGVRVEEPLAKLGVRLVYIVFDGVSVGESPEGLVQTLRSVEDEVVQAFAGPEALKDDPRVRAYRRFLWRLGIDPTKVRPSSEALARRVLRGSRIPLINNVVDAGNIASLKTMVPIGLYDLDTVKPPLRLTLSRGGEVFEPIGGRPQTLPKNYPILVDSQGLVMHVYPHRDSKASMITRSTRRVLAIAAGVEGVETGDLRRAIEILSGLLEKFAGAGR